MVGLFWNKVHSSVRPVSSDCFLCAHYLACSRVHSIPLCSSGMAHCTPVCIVLDSLFGLCNGPLCVMETTGGTDSGGVGNSHFG